MPFMRLTRGSKAAGIQTYAKAVRLPEQIRDHELEYLSARDWYANKLAQLAQFEEALAQAKAAGHREDIAVFSGKINGIQSHLIDARRKVKEAAERSYAETFMFVACLMLPDETRKAINVETERLLGRPAQELAA